jgi:hypothetical protein
MWDFRFSWWQIWKWLSAGLLHRVVSSPWWWRQQEPVKRW